MFSAIKTSIVLGTLMVIASGTLAQSFERGGMGYAVLGPSWIFSSRVDDYLSRPEVLGSSYQPAAFGFMWGGEGFVIRHRILIGGSFEGSNPLEIQTSTATVNEFYASFNFKTGYIFWDRGSNFMNFNLGTGFMTHSFDIRNDKAPDGIFFNQEYPVNLGEQQSYSYGGFDFDFGVGVKKVLGSSAGDKMSGVMLGIDAGCFLNIPTGGWYNTYDMNEIIYGPPSPGVSAVPYIRLVIGGGGFKSGVPVGKGEETPPPQK